MVYAHELADYASNPHEVGHVWFSESNAEQRVLRHLENLGLDLASSTVLDLGTGNGSMLFALREDGWAGEMLGIDYSESSTELARRVAERAGEVQADGMVGHVEGPTTKTVRFEVWDFMKQGVDETVLPQASGHGKAWDVVLDKGTFDAISLSKDTDEHGRRTVEGYRDRVKGFVRKDGGLLVLTSCNWTQEELTRWFVKQGEDDGFFVHGTVKYPTLKFGGAEGQTLSTVCFKRR